MNQTDQLREQIAAEQQKLEKLEAHASGRSFTDAERSRWNAANARVEELEEQLLRLERIEQLSKRPENREDPPGWGDPAPTRRHRHAAGTLAPQLEQARSAALRAVDRASGMLDNAAAARLEDVIERDLVRENGRGARYLALVGEEAYRTAFAKLLTSGPEMAPALMSDAERESLYRVNQEVRAMSLTDNVGGYAVPFTLDPSIIPTSDGVQNPIRSLATVHAITGDHWQGVTSAGVSATRRTEAAETDESTPSLVGPSITPTRADVWIPFSLEIEADFSGLLSELRTMIADAKDAEEADSFVNGTGLTVYPEGVVYGLAATSHVTTDTPNGFDVEDVRKLMAKLPPRFQPRAVFCASIATFNLLRGFDTYGASIWGSQTAGTPPTLYGKPAHEVSSMVATATSGDDILLYGDLKAAFVIVDRLGMSVELVPHVFGSNQRPTGQRGVYAFYRSGSQVVNDNAARLLTVGETS